MKFIDLIRGTPPFMAAICLIALLPARMCAAEFKLANDQVTVIYKTKGGVLLPDSLKDKTTGQVVKLGSEMFSLLLTNGDFIHSANFKLEGNVRTEPLTA